MLVGGVVLSFSNYPALLPYVLPVVGIATVAQLVLSVWALVNKWDNAYQESVSANNQNAELQAEWEGVINAPADNIGPEYERVRRQHLKQAQRDEQQNVSDKERRRGMRAALFKFQTACAVCKRVPSSRKFEQTDMSCDCCGNF